MSCYFIDRIFVAFAVINKQYVTPEYRTCHKNDEIVVIIICSKYSGHLFYRTDYSITPLQQWLLFQKETLISQKDYCSVILL